MGESLEDELEIERKIKSIGSNYRNYGLCRGPRRLTHPPMPSPGIHLGKSPRRPPCHSEHLSIYSSHEICWRLLSLSHSLMDRGNPLSWVDSWEPCNIPGVSDDRQCEQYFSKRYRSFDTRSDQGYSVILRKYIVPKTSLGIFSSLCRTHVSQPYIETGSTSDLDVQILVVQQYQQLQRLMMSKSITPHVRPTR